MSSDVAAVPSDLLAHIYTYLLENGFKKAAKVLKKSSGEELCEQSGPGLLEFFNYYWEKHAVEQCLEGVVVGGVSGVRKRKQKSDEGQNEDRPKKKKKKGQSVEEAELKNEVKEEDVVVVGDSEEMESAAIPVVMETHRRKKKSKKQQRVDEESVHKSEAIIEDLLPQQQAPPLKTRPLISQRVLQTTGDTSGSSSDVDGTRKEVGVAIEDEGVLCVADQDVIELDTTADNVATVTKKKKRSSVGATPFKRVTEDVMVDPRLQDNSFEAKLNSRGSWGERANKDLKFTKGKSFRHEKTKKKRGTYKGGAIDTSVCSIKFDSD